MTRLTSLDVPFAHDKITLAIDLDRVKKICAAFGGMVPAYRKIESLDSSAFCTIVAIGAEKNITDVEVTIYEDGLLALKDPLLKYLDLLANGGRELVTAA
jgi:hypothetical protein